MNKTPMSINISRNFLNKTGNNFIKISSVDNKNEITLGDFVRKVRNDKGLSTTEVERRSRQGGKKGISNAYISQIENNYIQNVSPDKLKALAFGLGITEQEIFDIVRGESPNRETVIDRQFENLSLKFSGLPPSKKEKAQALIDLMDREIERLANEK